MAALTAHAPIETRPAARRALAVCCGAHFLHDGFTDLIYVLLPVWQAEFGLSLAAVGILKTLFSGFLAGLQLPAGMLANRIGERRLLALGTALSALGYLLVGWSGSFLALALCLALAGTGSSVQHPLSATLTSRAFAGGSLRTALSTYNFSGDLGKVALPAATALMIALWQWRWTTTALAVLGFAVALTILLLLRPMQEKTDAAAAAAAAQAGAPDPKAARRGFVALSLIGIVDSATRTGFLTFLPFLLSAKGASVTEIGLALSLVFAGGATGKFVCGIVAQRVGILRSVILTECATSAGILALLPLPLAASLPLLPAIGIALNGTSSVLYGTVAELAQPERRARAFGIFYTVTIGAGAISPAIYGRFSDLLGVPAILATVALVVLLVLPLTLPLRRPLGQVVRGRELA